MKASAITHLLFRSFLIMPVLVIQCVIVFFLAPLFNVFQQGFSAGFVKKTLSLCPAIFLLYVR